MPQPTATINHATPRRVINQGEIYWVQLDDDIGAGIPHPYVVVQDNLFNHSRVDTVIVCALTSNLRRTGETPGNVLLEVGEGNLPKQSVVEVSKISSVAKTQLGEHIGTLSDARVAEILAGLRFLQLSTVRR
jgi:mRNA interferase MazF